MLDPNKGPVSGGTNVTLKGRSYDPFNSHGDNMNIVGMDNSTIASTNAIFWINNTNDTFCEFADIGK